MRVDLKIDRGDSRSLVDQVTDGVKTLISEGTLKVGDRLPPVRELAKELGVSLIVTRTAFRRLAQDGIVEARPRIGTVILDDDTDVSRGRVILVVPESDGNFAVNVMGGVMRRCLAEKAYRMEQVSVPQHADGKYDFRFFNLALRRKADLLVLIHCRKAVISKAIASRVPFVVITSYSTSVIRQALAVVRMDATAALEELWRDCALTKDDSLLEVGFVNEADLFVSAAVKRGVKASHWTIPFTSQGIPNRHNRVSEAALAAFERKLAEGKDWLPSVLAFNDDFVATGALLAMAHHGVKVPEDVRVVSFSVTGHGPVFYGPMMRLEYDPGMYGRQLSSAIVTYLNMRRWPQRTALALKYLRQ